MTDLVKRIFLDPSRCIGCRSCVSACRECDTHKGESMVYIDYLERHNMVTSSPTLCMHCEQPLAACWQSSWSRSSGSSQTRFTNCSPVARPTWAD